MAFTPPFWGPQNGIDSKDYVLHMQGSGGVTSAPVNLLGHSLTSPNQNLTDALQYVETVLRNGVIRTVSRTKRAAYETSRTYTVGFPSALWTPLMERSILGGCTTTLFLYFQCPEDRIYEHVDILPDATLNPAIEAEDVITTGEDTNVITFQSELQVPEKIRQWKLGYERIYDAGTTGLFAIALLTEDCPGCDFVAGQGLIVGGGDGTAVPDADKTADRFGSVTALTVGAAGDVITAMYTEGDLVITAVADDAVYATAAAGKLFVSRDGGATVSQVAAFTDMIYGIAKLGNTLILVGKENTTGAAKVYISEDNANTFIDVAPTAVTAMTASGLKEVAVDKFTGKAYMAGEDGHVLVGRLSGSSMTVTDIATAVGAGVNDVNSVAVLAKNHIIVVGAAGFAAESKDGGTTWSTVDFPGSGAILAVAGNQYRIVAGIGTALYERSIMTKNNVEAIALENGQTLTGNITRIVMGLEDNMNQFFAVTTTGEVVLGRGFYPNA